ncbi:hypothetical protein [Halosimplex carlsbadense]|uniref:hypothetical protein n=1 Tax=Halosimplex carlsbadense TaxID=171164 RepID=UPI0019553289|nr:hypothetical protein [Halosimplex carlsbadense]
MSDQQERARQQTSMHSVNTNASGAQRGQISPRFILGVFVLIVIAGPLANAAIDIQSSLASTPAFSWLSAGVIAILIVAAIIAAALGEE